MDFPKIPGGIAPVKFLHTVVVPVKAMAHVEEVNFSCTSNFYRIKIGIYLIQRLHLLDRL